VELEDVGAVVVTDRVEVRVLLDQNPEMAEAAQPELAAIVPELATDSSVIDADAAARVRVFDAAGQTLTRAAGSTPVVVILDDLHAADSPRWICCALWRTSRSWVR
jgi:hypothetical protein